jgi:hypothetical protein
LPCGRRLPVPPSLGKAACIAVLWGNMCKPPKALHSPTRRCYAISTNSGAAILRLSESPVLAAYWGGGALTHAPFHIRLASSLSAIRTLCGRLVTCRMSDQAASVHVGCAVMRYAPSSPEFAPVGRSASRETHDLIRDGEGRRRVGNNPGHLRSQRRHAFPSKQAACHGMLM